MRVLGHLLKQQQYKDCESVGKLSGVELNVAGGAGRAAEAASVSRLLPHGDVLCISPQARTSVSTDVVVLEVSNSLAQPSLFYHLGVRESFSMTNNVLLCSQAELPGLQALRVSGQMGGGDRGRVGVYGLPRMPVSDCLPPAGGCFPEEFGEQNLPFVLCCDL